MATWRGHVVLKLALHGQSLRLCNLHQQSRDLGGRLGPRVGTWPVSRNYIHHYWLLITSYNHVKDVISLSLANEPLDSRRSLSSLSWTLFLTYVLTCFTVTVWLSRDACRNARRRVTKPCQAVAWLSWPAGTVSASTSRLAAKLSRLRAASEPWVARVL